MFKNMKLGTKLITGFLSVSLMGLIISVIGILGMSNIDSYITKIYEKDLIGISYIKQTQIERLTVAREWRSVLIAPSQEESEAHVKEFNLHLQAFEDNFKKASDLFYTDEGKKYINEIYLVLPEWKNITKAMLDMIIEKELNEVTPELEVLLNKQLPIGKEIDGRLTKLADLKDEFAQKTLQESKDTYNSRLVLMIVLVSLGFAISVVIAIKFSRSLMGQIGGEPAHVVELVRQISVGDLSVKVQLLPDDKTSLLYSIARMREALNNAIVSINVVMGDISEGKLDSRIEGGFKGDFNKIKMGMNNSLNTIQATLNEVIGVTTAVSNGDLTKKITGEYHGAFGLTKDAVNNTVQILDKLVEEIEQIVYSGADCGDFSVKMTIHDKIGYGKRLAELINTLFATTEKSLNDVLRVSQALAKGDLTQNISDDYVGAFAATKAGMNATVENLKNLIGEIKETSHVIASASKEISAGNNDLSHRTEEQASSLQQTSISMDELSAAVKQNTENAKHANELASGASITAQKGVKVVNDVVKTMLTINESSRRIVDIITVIDDIAFQTNILALNAAVEAARAGEQGKGFAVVAVEVRNLAQRASNAAGEIKKLIDDSVENITDGSKQVEQAGKTMEDIVDAIQNVTAIMSEIAAASIQQNTGINQVHQSVTQMDTVTQQNAALVEEAAAAAESLSDQTRHLATEMAQFKIS